MTHDTRIPATLRRLPLAAALLAALPLAFPALAQQAPAADSGKLETVTITATKRLQPLQSTPIAVSVIGGSALEESNLNNLEAISAQVPTVNFRTNASNKDSALFIRGVGTISTSPGVEPTVSTVLDGVVTARPGQATLDLVDIDRIEVLRGPQGTLFGKNASAGVINIVSRAPSKAFSGYADLGLFQGGEKRIRLGASGELVSGLVRGSISAMAGSYDGNVTNVFDGSKVNGYDRKGLRARFDITPSKDLKIILIADRTEADDTPPTGVAYSTNVTTFPSGAVTANPTFAAAVAPVVASPSNRQINSEMKTRVNDVNSGFSGQVDWTVGSHQVTSITALRKWTNEQFQDADRLGTLYRSFNRLADKGNVDFEQTSQELRIASTQKGFVDYVAGVFYRWPKPTNATSAPPRVVPPQPPRRWPTDWCRAPCPPPRPTTAWRSTASKTPALLSLVKARLTSCPISAPWLACVTPATTCPTTTAGSSRQTSARPQPRRRQPSAPREPASQGPPANPPGRAALGRSSTSTRT
jgi:iron complex outermembrane receptor protein